MNEANVEGFILLDLTLIQFGACIMEVAVLSVSDMPRIPQIIFSNFLHIMLFSANKHTMNRMSRLVRRL